MPGSTLLPNKFHSQETTTFKYLAYFVIYTFISKKK